MTKFYIDKIQCHRILLQELISEKKLLCGPFCKGVLAWFLSVKAGGEYFPWPLSLDLPVLPQLKASLLKTNCKQIAIPEWNGTNFPTHSKSVYIAVVQDLINLKINGSKKSAFQILGSNHCNFLLPFPDRPNFFAVSDQRRPVLLYNYNYTLPMDTNCTI